MTSWLSAVLFVCFVSIALTFVPLFDLLAFEFAVTAGAVLTYVAGWRACGAAVRARAPGALGTSTIPGFPGAALGRVLGSHLLLALFPLGIIAANSLRVPTCNWSEGLCFYALFALPGVLYGTTLGFAMGLAVSVRRARLLFVLWSLATYAYALAHIVREPPIFAYNAFIGFFPGPIYDQAVPLTGRLVLARAIVALQALWFALVAVLFWDGARLRARAALFPWTGARGVAGPLAGALGAVLVVLLGNGDRLGFRPDADSIRRALGGHIATAHCDVYYDVQAYSYQRAQELAREHEFHYAELRDYFGFDVPRRIGSYVYANAEKKKLLMGAAGTSFEDALSDEFHLNAATWPHPVLRHEMAHIFAAHLQRWWPICPQIGIHEGIAVAAEWREESARLGLTPDEACAAMDSLGLLPDLDGILGAFGFWTQPGARAYTVAGAFVHYLVENYGMAPFGRLWASRDFEQAYGRSLEDLRREWWRQRVQPVRLTTLKLRRAERLYRPPALFALPCAREQARLQAELAAAQQAFQLARAESLYATLRRLAPSDPQLEFGRARLYLALGQPDRARRLLLELLEKPDLAPAWRGHALDDLGDALWAGGHFAAAESSFAMAESLATGRAERRAYRVARAALQSSELRSSLRSYLTEALDDGAAWAALAAARTRAPSSALVAYLWGRRLYLAERFTEAAVALESLPQAPSLDADVRLAALDLLASAQLRGGEPDRVPSTLGGLVGFSLEAAEQLHFEDLAKRAAWAVQVQVQAPGIQPARLRGG